jgi:hypothetical protein
MQERLESLERSNWHLNHQVNDLQRSDYIIKEVRIVELSYKDKCQCGVEALNRLLEDGFEVYKQFQTESGIVVQVCRWGLKHDE